MFTKETGKQFIVVLAAVMVGLAVHQVVVAPRLVKKGTATK
jgi:hypothetical protein